MRANLFYAGVYEMGWNECMGLWLRHVQQWVGEQSSWSLQCLRVLDCEAVIDKRHQPATFSLVVDVDLYRVRFIDMANTLDSLLEYG